MERDRIIRLLHGYHQGEKPAASDQSKAIPTPPPEKNTGERPLIPLPDPLTAEPVKASVTKCLLDRRSSRRFDGSPLSLRELSYLLWATQGIRPDERGANGQSGHTVRRTVPSAGSRHPFETYLIVRNVTGLREGIYRYVGSANALAAIAGPVPEEAVTEAACGQVFCAKAPVLFLWSVIPYRTEWRYGTEHSCKAVLLDAGHVGQNLHTACEALGLGTCMIGAYFQESADALLKLDGKEEMTVYMAPVGGIGRTRSRGK